MYKMIIFWKHYVYVCCTHKAKELKDFNELSLEGYLMSLLVIILMLRII